MCYSQPDLFFWSFLTKTKQDFCRYLFFVHPCVSHVLFHFSSIFKQLFLKAFWNTVRNASFWFLGLVTFVPLKRKPLQEDHHNFVQIDIDDWWCKDDNAAADDDDDDVEDDPWNDEWKNAEDWGTIVQLSPRQQ